MYHSGKTSSNMSVMLEKSYPQALAASKIRLSVMKNWADTLLLLQVSDETVRQSIGNEIRKNSQVITDSFEHLERAYVSNETREYLTEAQKKRATYTTNRRQFLAFIQRDEAAKAHAYLIETVKPDFDSYLAEIGKVVTQNLSEMNQKASATSSGVATLYQLSLLTLAFSSAFCLLFIVLRNLGENARYKNQNP